jgi:hypothetical protein
MSQGLIRLLQIQGLWGEAGFLRKFNNHLISHDTLLNAAPETSKTFIFGTLVAKIFRYFSRILQRKLVPF